MKRTLAALLLVSGLGGCMSPDSGKKVARTADDRVRDDRAAKDDRHDRDEQKAKSTQKVAATTKPATTTRSGIVQASATDATPRSGPRAAYDLQPGSMNDPMLRQAGGVARVRGRGYDAGVPAGPGPGGPPPGYAGPGPGGPPPGYAGPGGPDDAYGPRQGMINTAFGRGGILPAPGMGPQGVVAGVGMIGPGMGGPQFNNQRSSVRFVAPAGMKIAFQDPTRGFAEAGREAPAKYNFPQGAIYRLKLSGIPNRPGKNYYPTLEVYPTTLKTVTFLSHATVPVGFTDEDFEQVNAGNLVVKVIYLPDPAFQDLAAAEEIVSTRLEPGIDPIAEANRRGTILAVIRIGNIDLEDQNTPAMNAPPGVGYGPPPPGMMLLPPGTVMPPGGGTIPMPPPPPTPRMLPPTGEPLVAPVPNGVYPQPAGASRVPTGMPRLQVPTLSADR